jgi:hypothetical protein
MAVGAAVILCDASGVGPLVTSANVDDLRRMNFGLRALTGPLARDVIVREIARYDGADAARVRDRVRAFADQEDAVDQLVAVYEDARGAAQASPPDADGDLRAAAAYLHGLSARLRWTQSTRGLLYQLLRRGYFQAQRMAVLRRLLASRRRAQRLQRRLQRG